MSELSTLKYFIKTYEGAFLLVKVFWLICMGSLFSKSFMVPHFETHFSRMYEVMNILSTVSFQKYFSMSWSNKIRLMVNNWPFEGTVYSVCTLPSHWYFSFQKWHETKTYTNETHRQEMTIDDLINLLTWLLYILHNKTITTDVSKNQEWHFPWLLWHRGLPGKMFKFIAKQQAEKWKRRVCKCLKRSSGLHTLLIKFQKCIILTFLTHF